MLLLKVMVSPLLALVMQLLRLVVSLALQFAASAEPPASKNAPMNAALDTIARHSGLCAGAAKAMRAERIESSDSAAPLASHAVRACRRCRCMTWPPTPAIDGPASAVPASIVPASNARRCARRRARDGVATAPMANSTANAKTRLIGAAIMSPPARLSRTPPAPPIFDADAHSPSAAPARQFIFG
jgi:hypothetical protein